MMRHDNPAKLTDANRRRLFAYITDLELEVDRLRRQHQLAYKEVWGALSHLEQLVTAWRATKGPPNELEELSQEIQHLLATLRDLRDPPGYHPAHDQVIAVAVRPLVEQLFRWQQRFLQAQEVTLHLEMECEHVEWFPARLRHVLDSLISNAIKYRDRNKAERWVKLELRESPTAYEFRVTDNGVGLEPEEREQVFELLHRIGPARDPLPGVALAVVNLLVEQSGGSLLVESRPGLGTTFVVALPRYEVDDYLV
jgi:signal transduction histidine kinase